MGDQCNFVNLVLIIKVVWVSTIPRQAIDTTVIKMTSQYQYTSLKAKVQGITNASDNPHGLYKSSGIKKAEVKQRGMKIGHLVIVNAVQDIEDIQGQENWKEIVHTILRIGIIRALNESVGRPF